MLTPEQFEWAQFQQDGYPVHNNRLLQEASQAYFTLRLANGNTIRKQQFH